MRKLIIAIVALAFVTTTALAQSTEKGTAPPPAGSDTMTAAKDKTTKTKTSKTKKKKSAKKTGGDATTK